MCWSWLTTILSGSKFKAFSPLAVWPVWQMTWQVTPFLGPTGNTTHCLDSYQVGILGLWLEGSKRVGKKSRRGKKQFLLLSMFWIFESVSLHARRGMSRAGLHKTGILDTRHDTWIRQFMSETKTKNIRQMCLKDNVPHKTNWVKVLVEYLMWYESDNMVESLRNY